MDSAVATVSITVTAVNDAPVADDQSVTTAQDTAVGITLTGSDVDLDALTFSVVPLSGPTNGTLTGAAPSLTYTPNANFNGSDSFTFTVTDGALQSAPATVSITVTAVAADEVTIKKAEYRDGELRVDAESTDPTAVLTAFAVFADRTEKLLDPQGDGELRLNVVISLPQSVRFESHLGGVATIAVTAQVKPVPFRSP